MTDEFRTESDSLGDIAVPQDAYWGAQTQRAIENFPISGLTFERRFIEALGIVKKSAARANRELGLLDAEIADAITAGADAVIRGDHDGQFPVDVFQTGSGTSSNMNANEVIANLAAEELNEPVGERIVHPNDHVNFGQSSNDVIPTAMNVSALRSLRRDVRPALQTLQRALAEKAAEYDDVTKTGRTHLQDATPVRLGQEFNGYKTQITKGLERLDRREDSLRELALGGTATGTGLNTHPEFPMLAIEYISEETDISFFEADDHFEAQASHDGLLDAHSGLRTVAASMNKIANDLRLLASGPRNGLGELKQPVNQPGSSIMPGKINPVVAEAVNQVHKQVVGNDAAINAGASRGELELNLYKTMMAYNFLQSCTLLANAATVFAERFVNKLEVDRAACQTQVERSLALATALNPEIGYDNAAAVAKRAYEEGKTIREIVLEEGYLDETDIDRVLDPRKMTEPGILNSD